MNPDAPQRYVREEALRRGITVYVPTPRLRAGFKRLDPAKIPGENLKEAASLSKDGRWAEDVALETLPRMDAIVCGSVAVTRTGRRCGKGEGYSDLEYAILRELGHPPVPVATTVHAVQVVEDLPWDATDLPLSVIVTPDETFMVAAPAPSPEGIAWDRLTEQDYEEMPLLCELRNRTEPRRLTGIHVRKEPRGECYEGGASADLTVLKKDRRFQMACSTCRPRQTAWRYPEYRGASSRCRPTMQ